MPVTIQLFSTALEVVGSPSLALEISEGETVESVLARLEDAHPRLASLRPSLLIAVNCEYVDPGRVLADGDEIALIPPVQGG